MINLFNRPQVKQNQGVKYSSLLEDFLTPFSKEFRDVEFYDDIFEFAIAAWNLGNLKLIIPESYSDKDIITATPGVTNTDLLIRMINYKVTDFKEYTHFIIDYEIDDSKKEPILTVVTQEQETFLAGMVDDMEIQRTQDNHIEDFIDRTAILVKPLQPFLDWYLNLYPDDMQEFEGVKMFRTYLIDDSKDPEAWLKAKFDKIFKEELDAVHYNKKQWPQKRSFKMFKEWFEYHIVLDVYDFEKKPVSKLASYS